MLRRYDDLAERLPLFDSLMTNVRQAADDGAFEGVDPEIVDSMEGAVPVGLGRFGQLRIPESYNPEDGPPVLVLHEDETANVRWAAGMAKSMRAVFARTDIDAPHVGKSWRKVATVGGRPAVTSRVFIPETADGVEYSLFVPLFMSITSENTTPSMAPPLYAHEHDHWKFYMGAATSLYSGDGPHYGKAELKTIAERQAYETSYQIEKNQGFHKGMPSVEEFADEFTGLSPVEVGEIILGVFRERRSLSSIGNDLKSSLAALTLSRLFGQDDPMRTTPEEVEAYRTAKYT